MAKMKLSESTFTMIPEGTTVFKVVAVDDSKYEDFGKLVVKLQTAKGESHNENFGIVKENGEVNNLHEPEYTVFQGNLTDKVEGKFDVVVANIVADVIIMFCADVAKFMKDGGVFITSGIIDTREQDVIDAFDKYGFKIRARHTKGGWVCFETEV